MSVQRTLSPWTYLVRNPRRILPVFGIQLLVTCLMVAIVTATNAFEATGETYVKPLEVFTMVAPRSRVSFDEELQELLDANPALEQRVPAKSLAMRTPMIVGEGRAPVIALPSDFQRGFLERVGCRITKGELPAAGSDGAVVHASVLRARGMSMGDVFGQNVSEDDAILGRFTVVGVLEGPSRVGVVDYEHAAKSQSVLARLPPFELIYAVPGRKAESDAYLRNAVDYTGKRAFRTFDEAFFRTRLDRSMENLPLLIGFITGAIAIVVAFVTALLNVIAFQVREDEFGLYLAIGHKRGALVRKLAFEAGLVAFAGWLLGLALGVLVVWLYKVWALDPKGIVVWVFDPRPFWFSLSVPVLSAAVSALALARRLRRMDPVAIIQRRGI